MKLVIDRKIWLRGEGCEFSMLKRRSDGKFCCIGLYLKECGIDDSYLEGVPDASKLKQCFPRLIPEQAMWLTKVSGVPASAGVFYEANDYEIPQDLSSLEEIEIRFKSEADREAMIKELFLKYDVEVEFIN